MKKTILLTIFLFSLLFGAASKELTEQRNQLFEKLKTIHNLSDAQIKKIRAIIEKSPAMSQGLPGVAKHPRTEIECSTKLASSGISYENKDYEKICGAKYMAPVYKKGTNPEDAKMCIDQFEFPNIPCEYPLIWVTARDAALICEAEGKRLCDAHEWEGACAGSLEETDYYFNLVDNYTTAAAKMRVPHNKKREVVWAYGKEYRPELCGTGVAKTQNCDKANLNGSGVMKSCGSNHFPAGFFPECRSSFGVYDQHGNAAEHMNLPTKPSEMTSRGGHGVVEMKGSWFVFGKKTVPHLDDCRWRAPFWHGTKVMDLKSHANYHLGFRCCKSR